MEVREGPISEILRSPKSEISKTRGGQLNFLLKKGGSAKFLVYLTLEFQNFNVRFLARWPPVGGQKMLDVLPLENNDLAK